MKPLYILCFALFLGACTIVTDSSSTPTSTIPDAETAVSQKPTILPTVTPKPTSPLTPTPTQTPVPLPTETNTSTPTLTPVPTPKVIEIYESPDGEWVALIIEEVDDYQAYTFRAINTETKDEWIIESFSSNGFVENRIPIYWSENGEYMYFIHNGFGDGCGPDILGYDLHRLNLHNGETVEIVSKGHWFAIAPDETKAAYILDKNLVIHDLATSEEVVIELNYDPTIEYINFLDTTWSPDSNSILVLGAEDICATGLLFEDSYYIISQIDAHSYQQKEIIEDPSLRRIFNWTEPNIVEIYAGMERARLNLETGQIELDDK